MRSEEKLVTINMFFVTTLDSCLSNQQKIKKSNIKTKYIYDMLEP